MKKKADIYYFAAVITILAALVTGLFYLRTFPLATRGDGVEYVLQAAAFENHMSFGVTEEDLADAVSDYYLQRDLLKSEYYSTRHMHEYENAKYSNHFGAYSALVVPVKKIVSHLGFYPLWGFFITNFLMYIAAAGSVIVFLKTESLQKLIIVLLTLINPVIFYLSWTHTEVYIFSFVTIGLVFYANKKYRWAILFLSIAAAQNIGVFPFAMAVGIELIFSYIEASKEKTETWKWSGFLKEYWYKIAAHGVFFIPALIPLLLNLYRFHTVSLVADVARENKYLLHKALDYAFDLNLGIFPYEPLLLLLFIIMIIAGVIRRKKQTWIFLLGVGGVLYVISNQVQINCGMQFIMRYNVWIIPMLVFFVVLNWEPVFNTDRYLCLTGIAETVFTGLIICFLLIGGGAFHSSQFAPWTKAVLDHIPALYNPSHGIFMSRVLGIELYQWSRPLFYISDDGKIRKILLNKESEPLFFSDQYILEDGHGNTIEKSSLRQVFIDEGDYSYINVPDDIYLSREIGNGVTVDFTEDIIEPDLAALRGISNKEEWGRWTESFEVSIKTVARSEAARLKGHLETDRVFDHPQRVVVLVNDSEVLVSTIKGKQDIDFEFDNPGTRCLVIKLLLPDSVRPVDIMESSDERELGIGLRSLTISE